MSKIRGFELVSQFTDETLLPKRETAHSVGVIDGDYYGNPANEGHIFAQMKNITDETVVIEAGERIVQGVFMPFLVADGDEADGVRTGGFGSTGK